MDENNALQQSKAVLGQISDSFLNGKAILSLIAALAIAFIIGRLLAAGMRRVTKVLSDQADKEQDLRRVNFLRRIETLIILSIALLRMLFIIIAIYFWWIFIHPDEPGQKPTALIGASALAVVFLGGIIGPILRDLSYGGVMMAERWYGVGDYVKIDPFDKMQGVVERVTLRSTRIRGTNGEVIWVNNQNIAAVRITPRGVRTTAIDLFVSDLKRGLELIEETNRRLPAGPLMVVRPLRITDQIQVEAKLWHLSAVGETAPGREWLLEELAPKLIKELDDESKKQVIDNEPITRSADSDADKRMVRTINNARKSPIEHNYFPLSDELRTIGSKLPAKLKGAGNQTKASATRTITSVKTASTKRRTPRKIQ